MTTETEVKPKRLLFNRSGMAYILKPAKDGDSERVFKTGTAIEPLDIMYGDPKKGRYVTEEAFLLDYPGVVYADTIMQGANPSALKAEIAAKKKENEELTAENQKLRESLAAGLGSKKK